MLTFSLDFIESNRERRGEKKRRGFGYGRNYVRVDNDMIPRREMKSGGQCEVRTEKGE